MINYLLIQIESNTDSIKYLSRFRCVVKYKIWICIICIYIRIYTRNDSTQTNGTTDHVSWIRYAGICWMLDWSWTDLLSGFGKRHSNEGRAQCFGVHLHSSSTKVVILPSLHIGWLVPINQPFLNYTRSYACTDSRFCSQRHQSTYVSTTFFNLSTWII